MAAEAQAVARWDRVLDWGRVVGAVGDLITGEAERLRGEFVRGVALAFDIVGAGYRGDLLLRFHDGEDGLECHVVAFRGRNISAAIPDLLKVVRQTGAVALTLQAESIAHVRLYQRAGFEMGPCEMSMWINE